MKKFSRVRVVVGLLVPAILLGLLFGAVVPSQNPLALGVIYAFVFFWFLAGVWVVALRYFPIQSLPVKQEEYEWVSFAGGLVRLTGPDRDHITKTEYTSLNGGSRRITVNADRQGVLTDIIVAGPVIAVSLTLEVLPDGGYNVYAMGHEFLGSCRGKNLAIGIIRHLIMGFEDTDFPGVDLSDVYVAYVVRERIWKVLR